MIINIFIKMHRYNNSINVTTLRLRNYSFIYVDSDNRVVLSLIPTSFNIKLFNESMMYVWCFK